MPHRQGNRSEVKPISGLLYRPAFALAIVCTGLLIYNLVAMPIHKEQVFLERGTINTGGEMAILIGFVLVPMFNIVSLLWMLSRIRQAHVVHKVDKGVLVLGVLCLILLMGDKVMVDEIGREYMLGWEVLGEWIILYLFLATQLLYNLIILRRIYRACVA